MNQTIIDILNNTLKGEESDYAEFEQIRDCLAPHDGSRITMHLQKKLPEGMKLKMEDGKVIIKFERSGRAHTIAKDSNKVVDIAKLKDLDCCNAAAGERVQHLKEILYNPQKLETLINLCNNLKKGYELLKTTLKGFNDNNLAAYYNPAYYDAIRALEIPWDVIKSID